MTKSTGRRSLFLTLFLALLTAASGAGAAEMGAGSMDHGAMAGMDAMGRAPAGVGGGSGHHAGGWMLTYRFMYMDMEGNRDGTDGLSTPEVLGEFMVAPERMTMQMHMIGAMYGLSPRWTAMAMVPYVLLDMDHVTRAGREFTTETDGIGDVRITALYALPAKGRHRIHLNAGLSLPTGSIDERGATPMGPDQKLPYPMQLGSGTWDLVPGVTYRCGAGEWLWGVQALGTIRFGENDNDYTLGNRFETTAWLTRLLGGGLGVSARLDWQWWDDVDGADPELNPAVVPTADPSLRAGSRVDLLAGADFSSGRHTLALEGGVPVYQDLDGPQLETDWTLSFRWQWAF